MPFRLVLSQKAGNALQALADDPKKLRKVGKCLALLEANPRHLGLQTHEFHSMLGANGEKVWEAYVENNTPAAWRAFCPYGPDREEITILAITPHP